MNNTGSSDKVIAIIVAATPIIVEIIKTIKDKTCKPLPTAKLEINSNNNSNNNYSYVDKSKHTSTSKTVINNNYASTAKKSDPELEFWGFLAVFLIGLCIVTLLSIIIVKHRETIAFSLNVILFCILSFCLAKGIKNHFLFRNTEFNFHLLLALFGMILPYFSFFNISPAESFEKYHDRLIQDNSKDYSDFLTNLISGINANGWSTFYYVCVALGVVLAGCYVYLYFLKSKRFFETGDESFLKRKSMLVIGEFSVLFSIGGFYWTIYFLYWLLIAVTEWLKVNIPKLL